MVLPSDSMRASRSKSTKLSLSGVTSVSASSTAAVVEAIPGARVGLRVAKETATVERCLRGSSHDVAPGVSCQVVVVDYGVDTGGSNTVRGT